jgi:hypothetical protein
LVLYHDVLVYSLGEAGPHLVENLYGKRCSVRVVNDVVLDDRDDLRELRRLHCLDTNFKDVHLMQRAARFKIGKILRGQSCTRWVH